MNKDILYSVVSSFATITLNRPEKLNAFRLQTLRELAAALKKADGDRQVRSVVITGAGTKAFCVGGDIEEMKGLTHKTAAPFIKALLAVWRAIRNSLKPVIAKVNGYCLGGGNEIQLMCDLTIASETAKFGQTGPKVGSVPLWGGTQLLPRLVGEKRAREIIFLCRQYPATEAKAMGLVNEVVPESEIDARVDEVCATIARMSPQSLRLAKKSLNADVERQLLRDARMLKEIYGSPELVEGMSAFLEKRLPRWRN